MKYLSALLEGNSLAKKSNILLSIAVSIAWWVNISAVSAQEVIKLGVILHLSGPYAAPASRFKQGVEAYLRNYGTKIGGRELQVIYRDMAGAAPARAKQLTEELITNDGVSLIGGFYLSPEAIAAGPVLTEAKIPAVSFNAGSQLITGSSPYFVRPTGSVPQAVFVQSDFLIKQGKKNAYIAVADFGPGHEVQEAFKKFFTAGGGKIVGEDRIPLNTVDYSPFAERIAAANPDVIEVFIPSGTPSVAMTKALRARGLLGRPDLMTMGWGWIDDPVLSQYDDTIVGAHEVQTYALRGASSENEKFKAASRALFPDAIPSYEAASAYDGMHVIAHMIASQEGRPFDGPSAVQSVIGWSLDGARGTQTIEPGRAATMSVFVQKAVKQDGKLLLEVLYEAKGVPSQP